MRIRAVAVAGILLLTLFTAAPPGQSAIGALPAPTLLAPANGSTTKAPRPAFSWTAISGANNYRIQVATDASFTSIVMDGFTPQPTATPVSDLGAGTYYWRVKSRIDRVDKSEWTAAWSVTIGSPPSISGNAALLATDRRSDDTDDDLRRFAKRYALVFHAKPEDVPILRAVNAGMVILSYELPGGEGVFEKDWATVKSHPEWFAVDTRSQRLKSSSGYWMLRIGNLAYRNYEIQHLVGRLSSAAFDGVYFDVSMPWWAEREPFTTALGQPTEPDPAIVATWPQDMLSFHVEFKLARGSWWHIMNSWPLNAGRYTEWKYWLEQYLTEVTGVAMDGFGYNRDKPWREDSWKFQVDEIKRIIGLGKVVLAKCALTEPADRSRVQTFCFASYLLTADGKYAYYLPMIEIGDTYYDAALYTAPLGGPLGPYTQDTGKSVYRRAFANGFVLVNPSGATYAALSLGGTYRTLSGATVTSVTLAPYSAVVVVH